MQLDQKILLARLVAHVLITDAVLTDAEDDFLERLMVKLGLDAAAQRAVKVSVNIGDSPAALASQVAPEHRQSLLRALREAAAADGGTNAREEALIDAVVEVLAH